MHTDTASYLPLTQPTFYILLSLVPGKKHGYAILKDVEVSLSTSTLYSALRRLLDQALIERIPSGPGHDAGPGLPRKAYVLSELGRRVLEAETHRLKALVEAAQLRLAEEVA
jgi:PadR family transcriptional regulator PadR